VVNSFKQQAKPFIQKRLKNHKESFSSMKADLIAMFDACAKRLGLKSNNDDLRNQIIAMAEAMYELEIAEYQDMASINAATNSLEDAMQNAKQDSESEVVEEEVSLDSDPAPTISAPDFGAPSEKPARRKLPVNE
jgi:hypothetical protein